MMQASSTATLYAEIDSADRRFVDRAAVPHDPMFFVLRLDGSINYADVALRQLCGLPAELANPGSLARYVHRRDLIALRRKVRSSEPVNIDRRVRIRVSNNTYRECRVYATLIRTPELSEHWVGFCLADDAPQETALSAHVEPTLSLQNLMSGNDCVELLSLDERVWAMSMNGTQMPEPMSSTAGVWSDFWNAADRPAAIRALDAARAGSVGRFEGSIATGRASVSWWDVVITPILDPKGRPESLLAISREITHTKRLEAQLRFLAESSKVLGSSLDIDETLGEISRLAVPALASWCMISWQGRASRSSVMFAGKDAKLLAALETLTPYRWRTTSVFLPAISAEVLTSLARDDEHFSRLQTLRARSIAIVPLVCHDELLGSLSVGTIDRQLTLSDLELIEELGRRIAMAITNARLFEHERRVARVLQGALLPDRLPTVRDVALSTWYVSGKLESDVGGDWYDAFLLADGRLVLSIGDVCGSGLRAAVTMAHLRQAIRAIARTSADPATVLNCVDAQLKMDAPDALATAAIIVFDPDTHALDYALAGHPRPLVRTPAGEVVELGGAGLPLGLRGGDEPPTQQAQLSRGSVLTLYTDGLIEASRDVISGDALLRSAFARRDIAHAHDAARVLHDAVLGAGSQSPDDVAIITLEVRQRQQWQWQFHFVPGAADMKLARISLARAIDAAGGVDRDGAQVIFGELLSNVLRYAPGPSEVRLESSDEGLVLHVLDSGPGFDPSRVESPSFTSESRRGLMIVRALAVSLTIAPRAQGGMHIAAGLPRNTR
jgi:serine phosphatase RsbU (regulator of sigma subunit)